MREQLQARLEVLRKEFETGQVRLRDLERQQAALQDTMLRISGAMQVLEALLAEKPPEGGVDVEARMPSTATATGKGDGAERNVA